MSTPKDPSKAQQSLSHPAPAPDGRSSQPGLGHLAPDDGSHQAQPGPSEPGQQPTAPGSAKFPQTTNAKLKALEPQRKSGEHQPLTTNQGTKISDDQNSLRAGKRGPTLLEDFIMREKITHFDHERIPERIVHARGSAAHGVFEVYRPLTDLTKASFLRDPAVKTPVYVRFSTVQGSRGSADTVRDIRGFAVLRFCGFAVLRFCGFAVLRFCGFAVKFYTQEGNFDLVGNNTLVFFIQDAHKFPDFVHAVKPEPHNEMPQGGSAHDSFWDYVSLQPETLHNVFWAMSDRGIPRSLRTMEGFGIHTFRLVNAAGNSTFVRFHWKPLAGKASLVWDEAQKIAGKDPDFHRRDLWEAIEAGDYPEWELGLQLVAEEDEEKFDFDLLDPTKLIPEALVPVEIVGKLTLNRNPDNFFAETEQVAFHPGHIVPGIDFSNDPLLQGRLFSYTDTQISRLGGPNFHEIPINRPVCPYHNFQRDGMHRQDIDTNPAAYEPNSLNDNWPRETAPAAENGGFETYHERVDGEKIRQRSESFNEYFAHPRLFWLSQTPAEQQHIIDAFSFELSKVARPYIRERVIDLLTRVDVILATQVAARLGYRLSDEAQKIAPPPPVNGIASDPTLSLYATGPGPLKGRQVALLVSDGVEAADVLAALQALKAEGIHAKLLASHMGNLLASDGSTLPIDGTIEGNPSITVDGVVVPNGNLDALLLDGASRHYILEAYKHLKPIALSGDARRFKQQLGLKDGDSEAGISEDTAVSDKLMQAFLTSLREHRVWSRLGKAAAVPA